MADVDTPFSTAAVAAAATQHALARLLRGATWQGTIREIAWHAAAEADGGHELAVTVMPVADEVLSDLIDGVECRADAAALNAWHEHLSWRPHDVEGAELVATITASEEAERLVAAAYETTCRRTEEAARSRQHAKDEHAPRGRGLFRRRRRERSPAAVPQLDLGDFGRPRERYGWPRRDAA
jgi:hypothetical protein